MIMLVGKYLDRRRMKDLHLYNVILLKLILK